MAKLGLLFIAVFCIVQMSFAGRIVRDADDTSTPANDLEEIKKKVQSGIDSFQSSLSEIFTKENFDKAIANAKEYGEKIKDFAAETGKTIQKSVVELSNNNATVETKN